MKVVVWNCKSNEVRYTIGMDEAPPLPLNVHYIIPRTLPLTPFPDVDHSPQPAPLPSM